MHKVSNDAAVSSIDFNKLNSIDVAKCLKMLLDKCIPKLASAKFIKVFIPKLSVLLESQVFNCNLTNFPSLAKLQDSMVDFIQLKMHFVL